MFAARVGEYVQRHGDDISEDEAQRNISGLLEGWKNAMHGREGVMSRHDGSELRSDELRLPKLPIEERSEETKSDPLMHVTPPQQADHAILSYHNLMWGFDSMVVSEDRESLRLHLSAEFVMIRALIEAASLAVWILGPDDSDTRITRSLRFRYSELRYSKKLAVEFAKMTGGETEEAAESQSKFVSGQIHDLRAMALRAGISWGKAKELVSPSLIAKEAGAYVPELGSALTFWYWSTASSIAHVEPANMQQLADIRFIGVDVRDQPIAHVDPSAVAIWNHLKVAHTLITVAHQLWNERAAAPN